MSEKNIIEVNDEGILYLDEHGQKQFINFAACYQRYLDKWNDPDHIKGFKEINQFFSDEELEKALQVMREYREIGGRDFTVPYIEFYTDPPTRFTFSNSDEFRKVQYLARKAGWETFDRA